MPPGLCTGIYILQSSCSHRAEYEVANGVAIPNLGERRCHMINLGSTAPKRIVFQVADVIKVLAAVSALVDAGHRVVFDKDDASGTDIFFICN